MYILIYIYIYIYIYAFRLQLVEDEAERLVNAMKRTVRQGLGANALRRLLPAWLGGVESSVRIFIDVDVYMYVCMYMYIHTYMCIEREVCIVAAAARVVERRRELGKDIYIYIYM